MATIQVPSTIAEDKMSVARYICNTSKIIVDDPTYGSFVCTRGLTRKEEEKLLKMIATSIGVSANPQIVHDKATKFLEEVRTAKERIFKWQKTAQDSIIIWSVLQELANDICTDKNTDVTAKEPETQQQIDQ